MTTAAIVSDLHTNSTIGLCPPRFPLDDGGVYVASKAQRWLWRNWLDYIGRVKKAKGNGRLVTIFNGDICDGDHHNTTQIITRNRREFLKLAWRVIEPLVEISDKVIVIRGTPSHVGQGSWMEEAIGADIESVKDDVGRYAWPHAYLDIDGVTLDIAHHGSLGGRPWTRANAVNRLAVETIVKYADSGSKIPDLVIRSHRHQYADSNNNHKCRVIFTPAWQLATEFINKIAPGAVADIGGLIVNCNDGAYNAEVVRYAPSRARAVNV